MKVFRGPRVVLILALVLAAASAASGAEADRDTTPTFVQDVAPIFHQKCVTCHRPGQIGPMSLRTYEESRPWAKSIAKNVKSRTMPPWHADPGYGPFANDRSLTAEEMDTVVRWAKRGAPRGEGRFTASEHDRQDGEWMLGEPDHVIELDETKIPADGPDIFKDLLVELPFDEDRWIVGIEVLPGNRQVLHHVVVLLDGGEGEGPRQRMIGGWAAGADPGTVPERTGRLLPKGATLIADMHYHPSGEPHTDRSRVGLHFAEKEEIEKELVNHWIINTEFEIQPGDANAEARASYTFPQDSHIYSLTPHMHYRGKDFSFTANYPDGRSEEILKVSRYDFNWQTTYELTEPLAIPKGTRIDCLAHWDNSKSNPNNPDPTKTVRFGNQSFDEMMIGFVDYTVDEGVSPKPAPSPIFDKISQLASLYPGDVYIVEIQTSPQGPKQPTAIYVPQEGEGGWYVAFGSIVGRARVYDIAWDGLDFESKAAIPGQNTLELKGSTDGKGGLSLQITDPGGDTDTMAGKLATP